MSDELRPAPAGPPEAWADTTPPPSPGPTLRELVGSTNPHLVLAAPIEELLVPYDPAALAERTRRRRRAMWSRLVSLGITAVILVLLYLFGGDRLQAGGFLALYGFALGVSLVWFLGRLVAFLLARRDLRRVGTGTAVRIGRPGVQVAGVFAADRRPPSRWSRSWCTRRRWTAPPGPTPAAGTGWT
jgi:hypothetical protein